MKDPKNVENEASGDLDAEVVSIDELKAMFGATGGYRVTVACNVAPSPLERIDRLDPATQVRHPGIDRP